MKKVLYISMASILAFQSAPQFAMAQTAPVNPNMTIVGGVGSGTTGFLNPGEYGITQYTEVMNKMLEQKAITQKEDRQYLLDVGNRISDAIKELIEKQKAFTALSQKSQISNDVTLDQFLVMSNDINAIIARIRLEVEQSSIISMQTLPSYKMDVAGHSLDAGPGSLIDITQALKPFVDHASEIAGQLEALAFPKVSHKGSVAAVGGNALSPDLSKFPSMTPDEVQAALLEVETLSTISKSTKDKQQFLADLTVNGVKKYIQLVGVDKFLNIRNENDKNATATLYKQIEKYFFLRSYLRKKYGLQIGAINVTDYPRDNYLNYRDWFSAEALTPVKTALNSVVSQTAQTDTDIMAAFENARQFVEMYDRNTTPVLSKESTEKRAKAKADMSSSESILGKLKAGYDWVTADIAKHEEIMGNKPVILNDQQRDDAYNSDDTGIMARTSSMFLSLSGQMPTVEALLAVMRLVLADIREELMLSQGDYAALVNYHNKRFLGTDDQKIVSIKTMCDSDKSLTTNERAALADRGNQLLASVPEAERSLKFQVSGTLRCGMQAGAPAGGPSLGILGGQRTGGGNFLTQFNALIDQYTKFEVSRAQKARNLRQMIDASLNAQAQDGDATESTVTEGI
jgi:hypothetical protein